MVRNECRPSTPPGNISTRLARVVMPLRDPKVQAASMGGIWKDQGCKTTKVPLTCAKPAYPKHDGSKWVAQRSFQNQLQSYYGTFDSQYWTNTTPILHQYKTKSKKNNRYLATMWPISTYIVPPANIRLMQAAYSWGDSSSKTLPASMIGGRLSMLCQGSLQIG